MEVIVEIINGIPETPKLFHSEAVAFSYYIEICRENGVEFSIEDIQYPEHLLDILSDVDIHLRNAPDGWEINWWGEVEVEDE